MSIALILVGSFFLNWFWIVLTVLAQTNATAEDRAAAIGLVQTAGFFGAFIGPGLAGVFGGTQSEALLATVTAPYLLYVCVMMFLYGDSSSLGGGSSMLRRLRPGGED